MSVASLHECIIALAHARARASISVAEVNRLHHKLPRSLPQTEADRIRAVTELNRCYEKAISDSQEERLAALRCSRTLEYLAKHEDGSGRYSALQARRADADDNEDGAEGMPPPVMGAATAPGEPHEHSDVEGEWPSGGIAQPVAETVESNSEADGEAEEDGDSSVARGPDDEVYEDGEVASELEGVSELASELAEEDGDSRAEDSENAADAFVDNLDGSETGDLEEGATSGMGDVDYESNVDENSHDGNDDGVDDDEGTGRESEDDDLENSIAAEEEEEEEADDAP